MVSDHPAADASFAARSDRGCAAVAAGHRHGGQLVAATASLAINSCCSLRRLPARSALRPRWFVVGWCSDFMGCGFGLARSRRRSVSHSVVVAATGGATAAPGFDAGGFRFGGGDFHRQPRPDGVVNDPTSQLAEHESNSGKHEQRCHRRRHRRFGSRRPQHAASNLGHERQRPENSGVAAPHAVDLATSIFVQPLQFNDSLRADVPSCYRLSRRGS